MPNIRQFDAPNLSLNPSDEGVRAVASAGARIGRNFDQLATSAQQVGGQFAKDLGSSIRDAGQIAVDFADNKNRSDLAAASTQQFEDLDKNWNEALRQAIKDGRADDPALAENFRQQMEGSFDKLRDAAWTENGQKFAESRIAEMRQHFVTKTSADLSTAAGIDAKAKVDTVIASSTNAAYRDPTSVATLLQMGDRSIDTFIESAKNLRGVDAARLKSDLSQDLRTKIIEAGAGGALAQSRNPVATAKEWGARYPELSGVKQQQLDANARAQVRGAHTDQLWAEHQAEKEAQRKSDARVDGLLKDIYSNDPERQGNISARSVVNDPALTRRDKEHMIGIVNREMKPETDAHISARTSVEIMRKMAVPNSDPVEIRSLILTARSKDPGQPGSLTKADMNDLEKRLVDIKTPEGMALSKDREEFVKRFTPSLDLSASNPDSASYGRPSELGSQKLYEMESDLRRREQDLKKAGRDPHTLYDPSSPDFFGKPKNLFKYRVTMQEAADFRAKLEKGKERFAPPSDWSFSPKLQRYRDPQGNLYDINGEPVK